MFLAQVNIAQLIAPQGDPMVAGFFEQVPQVNKLAEASDGFVWRYEGDYPDPLIAFNMSVWSSLEDLRLFVYRSAHVHVLRRKQEWFTPMPSAHMALWWIDDNHLPTPDEGLAKLAMLNTNGPSINSFTFSNPFKPQSNAR
jgi:hypothetical protein